MGCPRSLSGFDHLFDFIIPKSRNQPERIIKTINNQGRNTAQAVAFAWIDIKEARPPDSKAYAIQNDSERPVPGNVLDALNNYGVKTVSWNNREAVVKELAT